MSEPNGRQVGVMTWYSFENYGSVLQAVALQRVLRDLGVKPELINYKPRPVRERVKRRTAGNFASKILSKVFNRPSSIYWSEDRSKLFKEFVRDHADISEPANSLPELRLVAQKYDAVICGSDQIWSPNCFDENYYLPFVNERERKIAYAPSFGVDAIGDKKIRQRMKALLSMFGSISVRENKGSDIVYDLIGLKPEIVLDPTLLLDKASWTKLAGEQDDNKDNGYILCYLLGDPAVYEYSIKKHAEEFGTSIVTIPTYSSQTNDESQIEIGPKEFINLFENASYVCTDSFHGIAFATNFGVPFTVYKRFSDSDPKGQNSRILSFLTLTGLQDRLLDVGAKPVLRLL